MLHDWENGNLSYVERKMMIGWDEISKNQLQPASTVVSYRGQEFASYAANKGYKVVFTPGAALYFDWYQLLRIRNHGQ